MTLLRSLRRVPPLLVVVGVLGLLAVSVAPPAAEPAREDLVGALVAAGGQQQSLQSQCDVDGIDVGYRTAYRSTSPLGYDVTHAVVSKISWPSCEGAVLSVQLGDGVTPARAIGQLTLSSGNVVVSSGNATADVVVRLADAPTVPPDARWVSTVGLTLDGGTTPIPPECAGMVFNSTFIGTNGDDVIDGTNPKNDLIYSLEGADRVDGRQGSDCIITGADAQGDTVTVGNANSVVRTGPGNDVVTSGNGAHRIYTNGGNDSITIGTGKGAYIDAGPGTDTCRVPRSVKQITLVSCEIRVAT
ncbi:MAG: calcium-binding protein [Microthrixaceae bacterium]